MVKKYKARCKIKISNTRNMSPNSLSVDLEIYGKEICGEINKNKEQCNQQ